MGTLNVDASTDGGVTWVNLWTLSGDQGNQWNEAVVDLSSYTSQIRLRVQGVLLELHLHLIWLLTS